MLGLASSEGLGLAARVLVLVCGATAHQLLCCGQSCDRFPLNNKFASEGDAATTWWRVLDVDALNLPP